MRNKQRRWLSQIFYNYGIEFVAVKIQWQGKPDNNIAESNFTLWINDFLTYYLAEEIRRKEGIQLLEIWELFPNTRPRFEVPVGLSGLETFSAVDLGKADEVDGSLFTFCTNLSQSVEFLQPSKKKISKQNIFMIELTAQTWRQKRGHRVLAINRRYIGKIKKSNGSRKKSLWLTCFPVWFLAFRFLRLDGLGCTRTFGRSRLFSSFVTVTWGELLVPEKEIKTCTSSGCDL